MSEDSGPNKRQSSARARSRRATRPDKREAFRAVLYPHRSLGPTGFLILMSAIGGVSFVTGMAFLLKGAWPVFGFFGLDVALIYAAFKLNYRSGRLYETVELTPEALTVTRVHPVRQSRRASTSILIGCACASPSDRRAAPICGSPRTGANLPSRAFSPTTSVAIVQRAGGRPGADARPRATRFRRTSERHTAMTRTDCAAFD